MASTPVVTTISLLIRSHIKKIYYTSHAKGETIARVWFPATALFKFEAYFSTLRLFLGFVMFVGFGIFSDGHFPSLLF